MSSFWEKALGTPAPAAQQQTVPVAPPSQSGVTGAWWSTAPVAAPATPQPQQTEDEPGNPLADMAPSSVKATASKKSGICPACTSGNYAERGLTGNAGHCFDCGYNEIMGDQLAGFGIVNAGEPSASTKQLASGGLVNMYSPTTIVGHI